MYKSTKNYTIHQFREGYPDDDACLDKLFQLRCSNLNNCLKCGESITYRRVPIRKCYQCLKFYHPLFPCKDTIFENTKLPLIYWF